MSAKVQLQSGLVSAQIVTLLACLHMQALPPLAPGM